MARYCITQYYYDAVSRHNSFRGHVNTSTANELVNKIAIDIFIIWNISYYSLLYSYVLTYNILRAASGYGSSSIAHFRIIFGQLRIFFDIYCSRPIWLRKL